MSRVEAGVHYSDMTHPGPSIEWVAQVSLLRPGFSGRRRNCGCIDRAL
jgi:hypothetical protein